MKVDVIRIGNSRGVRLPKAVLEQAGVGDVVELTVEDGKIILSPTTRATAADDDPFAAFHEWASEEDDRAYAKL